MSGALAQVPLSAEGIDPWAGFKNYYGAAAAQYAPAQAQANVGKTTAETGLIGAQIPEAQARAGLYGAQTGLVGEQTTGVGLENLQKQLMLNLKGSYAQRMQAGPQVSTSYPDQQGQGGGAPVEKPTGFPIRPLDQPPGAPRAIGANSAPPPVAPAAAPAPDATVPSPDAAGDQPPSKVAEGWATNGPVRPQIGLYGTESEPVQLAPPPGPVQSQPLPPPAIGGAPAGGTPAGGPAPAIGAGGARSAPGGGAVASSLTTGPQGEIVPGVGAVPWPMAYQMRMAIMAGQDPMKVQQQMMADKRQLIGQLVAQTVIPGSNPPRHDPQLWNQAVRRAYDDGLIDSAQEAQFYGHWERAGQLQSQSLEPDKQLQYVQQSRAAGATGEAQGGLPYKLVDVPITENGMTSTVKGIQWPDGTIHDVNGKLIAPGSSGGGGAGNAGGGGTGGTAAPGMSPQDYTSRSMQHEGGSGSGPRPNQSGPGGTPTSTAGGGQQFINGTWTSQMRETYPEWSKQYSDAQLLTLKGDNDVANQLTMDYANHNAPILGAAGIPATAANLRLAHALGPQGAVGVLKANPNTPLSQVLSPKAMDANPTWANQTAGQKVQEIRAQMGDGADLPVTGVAGGLPPRGAGGGVGYGKPEPGPAVANRITQNNEQLGKDSEDVDKIQGVAQAASAGMPVLYDIKQLTPQAYTGAYSGMRTEIANVLKTFSPAWMQSFLKATAGIDPHAVDATQELGKQLFKNVTSAESALGQGQGGVRVGAMLTQFFQRAMPNPNMQAPAIGDMVNWLLVGSQMVKDYAVGAQQFYRASRGTYQADSVNNPYEPLSTYHGQWLDGNSPKSPVVYEAAALAMNGKDWKVWTRGLTPDQISTVGGIVSRADPAGGSLKNSAGKVVPAELLRRAAGG